MNDERHTLRRKDLPCPENPIVQACKLAGAIGILLFLLPPLGYRPTEAEVIFNVIVFGIGGYLAYSSVRNGHAVLRILGVIVLSTYVVLIAMVISSGCENVSDITRYWHARWREFW